VWRIKEAFILCLQFVCGRVAANGVTQPLLPEPKGGLLVVSWRIRVLKGMHRLKL
jgi:hypothetical protein